MTTLADLEASVRLAHIAAARTRLAAALISLQSAERQLRRSISPETPRGPMHSLSDGQMRGIAWEIDDLAQRSAVVIDQLERLEARQ